jgi:hypothetical protein
VTDALAYYRVVYSEGVREAVRRFAGVAKAAGTFQELVAAVRELDRRLHIYPQFGDPIIDLAQEPGQVWLGTVPPLVARYAIYEQRRLVIVTVLRLLPQS